MIGTAVMGLGIVAVGYTGLGAQDRTTLNEAGTIAGASDVRSIGLQLGDCLDGMGSIDSMRRVPCSAPHEAEIYHVVVLPHDEFPEGLAIQDAATSGCLDAFEPFVGREQESSIYDISSVTPSRESWDDRDDRHILCLINTYDGSAKIGSANNRRI